MIFTLISILSFLICYFFIYINLPFFNKYLLYKPVARSSHKNPIPTGAGIIFSFTSAIFCSIFGWYIPLTSFPLSCIGFIDDIKSISRSIRYFSQIFTGLLLIFLSKGLLINLLSFDSGNLYLSLFLILVVVFFITGIINFFNFMDGIDGLVTSIFIFYLSYLCFMDSTNKIFLLMSLISFLCFNWMPAKIFMGDSGSTFIGSVYAGTLLEANNLSELILRLIILTPILGDAFITLILRIKNKKNIFKAHKSHLYQRLNQAGMDHAQISLLYLGASVLLCILGIYNIVYGVIFSLLVIIFGVYLNQNKAVPFNKYY